MILTHEGVFLVISNPLGIFLNPFNSLGMFLRHLVPFNLLRLFLSFRCLCNILATLRSTGDFLRLSLTLPVCREPTRDILKTFFFFWLNYMQFSERPKLHVVQSSVAFQPLHFSPMVTNYFIIFLFSSSSLSLHNLSNSSTPSFLCKNHLLLPYSLISHNQKLSSFLKLSYLLYGT